MYQQLGILQRATVSETSQRLASSEPVVRTPEQSTPADIQRNNPVGAIDPLTNPNEGRRLPRFNDSHFPRPSMRMEVVVSVNIPTSVGPGLEFVVTSTLIVADVARSAAFYRDVLDAEILAVGEPTFVRLGNLWLSINVGGGPTDDKPDVFATPPKHPNELSIFLNLRVSDVQRFYERWRSRGAVFVTEPKVHASEIRCYLRDPDGYLIEVGQTTSTRSPFDLYK
jgi:catechol 2,3-dioxygenase-like lactoylglutathione lyase family enzyme